MDNRMTSSVSTLPKAWPLCWLPKTRLEAIYGTSKR